MAFSPTDPMLARSLWLRLRHVLQNPAYDPEIQAVSHVEPISGAIGMGLRFSIILWIFIGFIFYQIAQLAA
jgi:hypothetical protein